MPLKTDPGIQTESYHVTLATGERNIPAARPHVEACGALVLTNSTGTLVGIYAPGQWTSCEPERRDDKG